MSTFGQDFVNRAKERAKPKGSPATTAAHVYHATTYARLTAAELFVDQLRDHLASGSDGTPLTFVRRDMYMFGFANSLRSSLDSLAHELFDYYEGTTSNPRRIQFYNLLRPDQLTLTLPPPLVIHISDFQSTDACTYLNGLRNGMQHRHFPLIQFRMPVAAAVWVKRPDGEQGSGSWEAHVSGQQPSPPVPASPPASRSPLPPDLNLSLPDDPQAEVGTETYARSRPILGTFRHLLDKTREFILTTYELAQ